MDINPSRHQRRFGAALRFRINGSSPCCNLTPYCENGRQRKSRQRDQMLLQIRSLQTGPPPQTARNRATYWNNFLLYQWLRCEWRWSQSPANRSLVRRSRFDGNLTGNRLFFCRKCPTWDTTKPRFAPKCQRNSRKPITGIYFRYSCVSRDACADLPGIMLPADLAHARQRLRTDHGAQRWPQAGHPQ